MERWFERFTTAAFQYAADLAHDLKTPLNIAVLNLELLRMRVQKLAGGPDEKLHEYTRAIDTELRRMARIFDAYFVYSVPPKGDEPAEPVAVNAILTSLDFPGGWRTEGLDQDVRVLVHRSRFRDLARLLLEAAGKIFSAGSVVLTSSTEGSAYRVRIAGTPAIVESDLGKLFKFYYTDTSGNPEIALATARLIAKTYGGNLSLWDESGNRVVLDLQLPLLDRVSES